MRDPHPFVEIEDWRKDHRTFQFTFDGFDLYLITQEGEDGPRSLLGYQNSYVERAVGGLGLTSLPCILNVEAAVAILRLAKEEREYGRLAGIKEAQRDMRRVMGID